MPSDQNADLVGADPAPAAAPDAAHWPPPDAPAAAAPNTDVLPHAEPAAPPSDPEPVAAVEPVRYVPVGGQEIQDYLNAKARGLEGSPSRDEVRAFLAK